MGIRERILVIRLLEKVEKYPSYAKAIGVEASGAKRQSNSDQTREASQ